MSYLRTYLVFVVAGLLGACSNSNSKGNIEKTAFKTLPQIYLLWDQNLDAEEAWLRPREGQIEVGFPTRVERQHVKDLPAAKNILQEWNARPIDLLVLGPGLPQRAYEALSLSRNPARGIIYWNSPASQGLVPQVTYLSFDWTALAPFFIELCGKKLARGRGCNFYPPEFQKKWKIPAGPLRVTLANALSTQDLGDALAVRLLWPELFLDLYRLRAKGQGHLRIDFRSGYFEFPRQFFDAQTEDRKFYEESLKNWSLKSL